MASKHHREQLINRVNKPVGFSTCTTRKGSPELRYKTPLLEEFEKELELINTQIVRSKYPTGFNRKLPSASNDVKPDSHRLTQKSQPSKIIQSQILSGIYTKKNEQPHPPEQPTSRKNKFSQLRSKSGMNLDFGSPSQLSQSAETSRPVDSRKGNPSKQISQRPFSTSSPQKSSKQPFTDLGFEIRPPDAKLLGNSVSKGEMSPHSMFIHRQQLFYQPTAKKNSSVISEEESVRTNSQVQQDQHVRTGSHQDNLQQNNGYLKDPPFSTQRKRSPSVSTSLHSVPKIRQTSCDPFTWPFNDSSYGVTRNKVDLHSKISEPDLNINPVEFSLVPLLLEQSYQIGYLEAAISSLQGSKLQTSSILSNFERQPSSESQPNNLSSQEKYLQMSKWLKDEYDHLHRKYKHLNRAAFDIPVK